jgi:hypothetical protein
VEDYCEHSTEYSISKKILGNFYVTEKLAGSQKRAQPHGFSFIGQI